MVSAPVVEVGFGLSQEREDGFGVPESHKLCHKGNGAAAFLVLVVVPSILSNPNAVVLPGIVAVNVEVLASFSFEPYLAFEKLFQINLTGKVYLLVSKGDERHGLCSFPVGSLGWSVCAGTGPAGGMGSVISQAGTRRSVMAPCPCLNTVLPLPGAVYSALQQPELSGLLRFIVLLHTECGGLCFLQGLVLVLAPWHIADGEALGGFL